MNKTLPLFALLILSAAPARAVIRVTEVTGEAELLRGGNEGSPVPLAGGETLSSEDRVVTGMDSTVAVAFDESSVVVIRELTDVKIGEHLQQGDSARTRLWLKAGEVSAEVRPNKLSPSDFAVKTPTATCSVRGTGLDVGYSSATGRTLQRTRHGNVLFAGRSGQSTSNGAGQQSEADESEVKTDTEVKTSESTSTSLPSGATEQESDAVEESGSLLTNTGAGAPGDVGSTGSSNSTVAGFSSEASDDSLPPEEPLPPGDPFEPDLFQVVAVEGDRAPDVNGDPGAAYFTAFGVPAIDGAPGGLSIAFPAETDLGEPGSVFGIYMANSSGLEAIAFEGYSHEDPEQSGKQITHDRFHPHIDVEGTVVAFVGEATFQVGLDEPVTRQALFQATMDGVPNPVVETGETYTIGKFTDLGMSGSTSTRFGDAIFAMDFNEKDFTHEVAFTAVLEPNPDFDVDGIFVFTGTSNPIEVAQKEGDEVQSASGSSVTFQGFEQSFPTTFKAIDFTADVTAMDGVIQRQVSFVGHYGGMFEGGEGVFVRDMLNGRTIGIADTSTAMPGNPTAGESFGLFTATAIEGNTVAFIGADSAFDHIGIYRVQDINQPDFALETVVDAQTSFGAGHALAGRRFTFFEDLAMEGGLVTFTGTHVALDNGDDIVEGLFHETPTGDIAPILQEGDTFAIASPAQTDPIEVTINNVEVGPSGATPGTGAALVEIEVPPPAGGDGGQSGVPGQPQLLDAVVVGATGP